MKSNLPTKEKVLKDLQIIPGVGKSIAEDLWSIDIRTVSDLKRKNPEKLYERLCDQAGMRLDPCLLYVMRCAVYYASEKKHKPELLLWWNWKDRQYKPKK
jgi:hypothetical protein